TFVTFPSPVPLPASKKIFLIIEFRDLIWVKNADPTNKDSITLLSTENNQVQNALAWEQWDNEAWFTIEESWGGTKINHHIYPLVSAASDGCVLPVTFGSFTAKNSPLGIDLHWQTWTETNNKRFEVERSEDGLKFTSIGTVMSKAVNGAFQGLRQYQFTDAAPLAGPNLYRIRQVDQDGSSEYTKTIKIVHNRVSESALIRSYYPNPVSDRLVIQLAQGIRAVESLLFTDGSGRVVSSLRPAVSPEGIINVSTQVLRSGMHFATIMLPDGQRSTIKLMKE
ncbi:MAG TPA: T9SS type A sorting domain-containing protein, partial [Phnomibacter sp.]|nr:T9SS type A sorting domain-containing protein [Phnomibacter sp.]